MKKIILFALSCVASQLLWAGNVVKSPNGRLALDFDVSDGRPLYTVSYDGVTVIASSPLGIETNMGDYTTGLKLSKMEERKVSDAYSLRNIK